MFQKPDTEMQTNSIQPLRFSSEVCDGAGEAGGCVLGGPWRLTEPCDATVGGATWLDQAQETAARTNQNAGPHRRKVGQQSAAPASQEGGGGGGDRIAHRKRKCPQGPERKRRCKERHGTADSKGQSREDSHHRLQEHLITLIRSTDKATTFRTYLSNMFTK